MKNLVALSISISVVLLLQSFHLAEGQFLGPNEPCVLGDTENLCNLDLNLICDAITSTCQCPDQETQIFDEALNTCAQTLNTTCYMDHSQALKVPAPGTELNCVSNAYCEMEHIGEFMRHYCNCNEGYVPSADLKTCVLNSTTNVDGSLYRHALGHGEACVPGDTDHWCDEALNLICDDTTSTSTCQCPDQETQIFDEALNTCAQTFNTTCYMDHSQALMVPAPGTELNCVSNAYCEMEYIGELMRHYCNCNDGYVPSADLKTCVLNSTTNVDGSLYRHALGHGEACVPGDVDHFCNPELNLICDDTTSSPTCQCPDQATQIFDEALNTCAQTLNTVCYMDHSQALLVPTPGTELSCVSNAYCEMEYVGELVRHFCKCNAGYMPSEDSKTCIVDPNPTTATAAPSSVDPNPTTATAAPSSVDPNPTTATAAPSSVDPSPTTEANGGGLGYGDVCTVGADDKCDKTQNVVCIDSKCECITGFLLSSTNVCQASFETECGGPNNTPCFIDGSLVCDETSSKCRCPDPETQIFETTPLNKCSQIFNTTCNMEHKQGSKVPVVGEELDCVSNAYCEMEHIEDLMRHYCNCNEGFEASEDLKTCVKSTGGGETGVASLFHLSPIAFFLVAITNLFSKFVNA